MGFEIVKGVINRPVFSGHELDHLFPKSNCNIQKVSFGRGCVAAREVVVWSKQYKGDTKNFSNLLINKPLQDVCSSIQYFLYSHIQYSYNDSLNIKSPACVWSSKTADCKSFSVFASTILLNLGIKHYFRGVHYNNKGGHVYIVVPKNQKKPLLSKSSMFCKDYFIIDGTTNNRNEPIFDSKRYDFFMDPNNLDREIRCIDPERQTKFFVGLTVTAGLLLLFRNT